MIVRTGAVVAQLEREIGTHWRLMHHYRREARRRDSSFDDRSHNHVYAQRCRDTLWLLLTIRRVGRG